MGWRFQKRIKLFPGVRVNLSKSGVSTSVGRKGLTVNFRGDKIKATAGLPGTGLSYSETSNRGGLSMTVVAVAVVVLVLWLLL